ncbi:MAG: hypothetical protein U0359_07565 [Byssovorax sp.]
MAAILYSLALESAKPQTQRPTLLAAVRCGVRGEQIPLPHAGAQPAGEERRPGT